MRVEFVLMTDPENQNPTASDILAAKERNEDMLLSIRGVQGVAVGRDELGRDTIQVYVLDDTVVAHVPREIEGFPVTCIVTGEIQAQ